jgi:hypothetical protein
MEPLKMKTLAILVLVSIISGCAALEPNTVNIEAEHMSHLTQHRPFTDHPTDYGANELNVLAHWKIGSHAYAEVGEGYNFSHNWPAINSHGEIIGPREQFTARFGYSFQLKP